MSDFLEDFRYLAGIDPLTESVEPKFAKGDLVYLPDNNEVFLVSRYVRKGGQGVEANADYYTGRIAVWVVKGKKIEWGKTYQAGREDIERAGKKVSEGEALKLVPAQPSTPEAKLACGHSVSVPETFKVGDKAMCPRCVKYEKIKLIESIDEDLGLKRTKGGDFMITFPDGKIVRAKDAMSAIEILTKAVDAQVKANKTKR